MSAKSGHPYKAFERTAMWRAVSRAVDALVKNGDLTEQTARTHIVGYVVKSLVESGVRDGAAPSPRSVKTIEVDEKGAQALRQLGFDVRDVKAAG